MEKAEAIKTIKTWDDKYKAASPEQTVNSNDAIKELQKVLDAEKEPRKDVNPDGQIAYLTDADFDAVSTVIPVCFTKAFLYEIIFRKRTDRCGL